MTDNPHIGSDALAFLESIVPDTPETRRVEKQEQFRIALTQAMRDLRNQVGLTQKELAQKLGIGQSWVSKLESANNDHTFESVLAYLDALGANFQASILLEGVKVAVISSDSSFLLDANTNEEVEENCGDATSQEANSPEFEFIQPEKMSQCEKAQSVVAHYGWWSESKGVAA